MIKSYLLLTKPGIIFGNLFAAIAGFFLASKGHPTYGLFLSTMAGISLVISSGCVVNNYTDRKIDGKMERTKNRALARGIISGRNAIIYSLVLGLLGFLLLAVYTNFLTVSIGIIGYFFYVVLYSILKRRSPFGTIVGSISGAVPPVAGYTAVTNHFDIAAFLLFMILVLWQMPHFYAIAIYRFNDYADASIPVLPVKKGIFTTKIHMLLYIIAFIITTIMLTVFGYTGFAYLIVAVILGFTWLGFAIKGFFTKNTQKWTRQMFIFSLVILILLCIMIPLDTVIPKP